MIQPAPEHEPVAGDSLDEELVDRVAAYDERLRAGALNDADKSVGCDASTPADLRSTLYELG
jgi:hypothetical protein